VEYSSPVRRFLREGAPYLAVLAVFALACAALVAVAAVRSDRADRGFARFTATQTGCVLDEQRALNALACAKVGGQYRITFNVPLADSTPVVTRESEGGPVSARVIGRRAVLVRFPATERYPSTVSVLLP
jgi:hypothetical protein